MTHVKHDLCVVVGHYTDREGKEKNRYQKVGVELETDTGGRIILLERWFNPAGIPDPEGRGTIMLSMFDPKDNASEPPQRAKAEPAQGRLPLKEGIKTEARVNQQDEFTDDIPFS